MRRKVLKYLLLNFTIQKNITKKISSSCKQSEFVQPKKKVFVVFKNQKKRNFHSNASFSEKLFFPA